VTGIVLLGLALGRHMVTLTWLSVAPVTVDRKLHTAKAWVEKASVAGQTWTDTAVGSGKSYDYQVCNGAGCSNVVTVTIP